MANILLRPLPANGVRGNRPLLLNKLERSLLWTGLGLRFLVSNALLNTLYPYTAEGGNPFLKIHPGTYLIILVFLSAFIRLDFVRALFDQARRNFFAFLFLIIIGVIAAISVWRFGFSGLAYLIDTWIAAIITAMLLKYVKPDTLTHLSKMILVLIFVNSIMALAEYVTQTHFMPYDTYSFFKFFRASAIFGHPLTNSLITSSMLLLVFAMPWRARTQWILVLTYLSAIMAFGARAAFAVSVIMLAMQQFFSLSGRLLKGRLTISTLTVIPFALLVGVALLYILLFETTLGTRIVDLGLLTDSSANARFKVGTIFKFLEPEQLLWGLPSAERMIIVGKSLYFSVIENFWVGLVLNFGIILFIPFVVSFLGFLFGLARGKGGAVGFAVVTFLLVASANNSLSAKTPDLVFFVCAIAGIGIAGRIKLSTARPAMVGRQ